MECDGRVRSVAPRRPWQASLVPLSSASQQWRHRARAPPTRPLSPVQHGRRDILYGHLQHGSACFTLLPESNLFCLIRHSLTLPSSTSNSWRRPVIIRTSLVHLSTIRKSYNPRSGFVIIYLVKDCMFKVNLLGFYAFNISNINIMFIAYHMRYRNTH